MADGNKHKKRHRAKLPKRIAGVKVPKALRKDGAVRKLAANPLVRDIVATALTAAAAAIGNKSTGAKAGGAKAAGGGAIVAAFAAAATDVVRQLRERQTTAADAGVDPAPHTKPATRSATAEPPITH